MAWIYPGIKCCISQEPMQDNDYIVGFSLLPPYPDEHPLSICYDALALRTAFEKWEYKDLLIQEIAQVWREFFTKPSSYVDILHQDEDHIIIKRTEGYP
ncbi:MAG TPA: hypothetical protein VLL52_13935 [Anaerolineae bacterium]|nr:hypothetical protein [Anaerolineae bacterium]